MPFVPKPIVYVRTPNSRAISAAVKGGIEPLVLKPSVNKITTLLFVSLSFKRFTAVANPKPIAVPSSIMPCFTSLNKFFKTAWSVVNGDCVKLSPLKVTKPILSFGLFSIKSTATSLDASNRFGFKSSANIDPEISMVITMSIPSVVTSCQLRLDCGLANVITNKLIPTIVKANGRCLKYS